MRIQVDKCVYDQDKLEGYTIKEHIQLTMLNVKPGTPKESFQKWKLQNSSPFSVTFFPPMRMAPHTREQHSQHLLKSKSSFFRRVRNSW